MDLLWWAKTRVLLERLPGGRSLAGNPAWRPRAPLRMSGLDVSAEAAELLRKENAAREQLLLIAIELA